MTSTSCVPATTDYGTARANGTVAPRAGPEPEDRPSSTTPSTNGDREERVVNQEETLAAREKQKRIKEAFRSWVFSDPERTERLVRIYNDTYNNLRFRVFDGSHLDFPGHEPDDLASPAPEGRHLAGDELAATRSWPTSSGPGRRYTMAAIGMKRQAGRALPEAALRRAQPHARAVRPRVPAALPEREAPCRDQGRPGPRAAEDPHGEDRELGVGRHHHHPLSFERIGMSREYQARFLREQIAEYDELLVDSAKSSTRAHRNIIKTIEKQKARREERLKELLAEDKKDDGLVFDELGVDYLFIDEAHYFKNLETPTKMERVAGHPDRRQRAGVRPLHEGPVPGRAAPRPRGHVRHGHARSRTRWSRCTRCSGSSTRKGFAAAASSTSTPGPRPSARWSTRWRLPRTGRSLQAPEPVREVRESPRAPADVPVVRRRPDGRDARLAEAAGSPATSPRSSRARCRTSSGRFRSGSSPATSGSARRRSIPREDNALAITTDGRKLALDARLISGAVPEFSESKITALVERVSRHLETDRGGPRDAARLLRPGRKSRRRGATRCTRRSSRSSSPPASHAGRSPRSATPRATPRSRPSSSGCGRGRCECSSAARQKMGTGANVQRRLVALHHLDAPWKPAEVEQREGRILRQGNENKEVSIFRYVTEGSFDAYMWQALETKARFIGQVMTGESGVRQAEDIGGQELSYAEVKAIASGNPAVLTLAEADAELQRLCDAAEAPRATSSSSPGETSGSCPR